MEFEAIVVGSHPTTVRLVGDLDAATAPEVDHRLARIDGDIELDCSGLDFVGARGLGMFVSVRERCAREGTKVVLVDPSPRLLRLLRITGLDMSLDVRSNGDSP